MNRSLLYIKQEAVDKTSLNFEILFLSVERMLCLASNLYKQEKNILMNVYILPAEESLISISGKEINNYIKLLEKSFKKVSKKKQSIKLEVVSKIDLDQYKDIYFPSHAPNGISEDELAEHHNSELKKYLEDVSVLAHKKHSGSRMLRIFKVLPNTISLNLIKAHRDDCYFLKFLETFSYMKCVINLPSSGKPLSENQIEDLLPNSKLTLNHAVVGLETLTPMAKKGIASWPIIKAVTNSFYMPTNCYYSAIGRLTVNDYGPNQTKYGFRTAIPRRDEYKLDHEKRILLLGGSFVYGHGLPPHRTIGSYMEKILNHQHAVTNYRVIDISGCRETLFDQMVKLYQFYSLIKPDIIIPIAGLNDIHHIIKSPYEYDAYSAMEEAYPIKEHENIQPFINHLSHDIYENIRSKFSSISGFAESEGMKSLMYLQPYPSFLSLKTPLTAFYLPKIKKMQEIYDSILLKFSQDSGPVKVGLQDFAYDLIKEYYYPTVFFDNCHVTSLGAKLVAEKICEDIKML